MNTLNLICILLLILLLPTSLLGPSGEVFFTEEELNEMGIRIESPDIDGQAVPA